MGRAPCCDKANVKKGPWSPEEDAILKSFIEEHGTGGNWIALPNKIGLKRCGKSCRLRWLNYLRPNIKHGGFTEDEENVICSLYVTIGSRWSIIAAQLPGRTDNDIKNYWNTRLKKKFFGLSRQRRQQQPQQQEATNNNLKLLHHNHVISGSFCSPYYPQAPPLHPSNFTLNEEDIPIIAPFEEKNMCITQHDPLPYDTNIWGSYVEGTYRASDYCFDCVQEGQISTFMNDTSPMHWGGDFEAIPMEEEMVHLGAKQMHTIDSSIITTREEHGVCNICSSSISGYEACRKICPRNGGFRRSKLDCVRYSG